VSWGTCAFVWPCTSSGDSSRGMELLFDHRDYPEAGKQIPAGGADNGESIEAVLREALEETGLGLVTLDPLHQYGRPVVRAGPTRWLLSSFALVSPLRRSPNCSNSRSSRWRWRCAGSWMRALLASASCWRAPGTMSCAMDISTCQRFRTDLLDHAVTWEAMEAARTKGRPVAECAASTLQALVCERVFIVGLPGVKRGR
jgi:hypothetical protein